MPFGLFSSDNKTFRPLKKQNNSKRQTLAEYTKKTIHATLGGMAMTLAVRLPDGEDVNDWISCNAVDFFNELSLLYASCENVCTPESCPAMTAGERYSYRWADGVKVKKPQQLSAPDYVEAMMVWAESQLNDPAIFPVQPGQPYPRNFLQSCKQIFKRFFRVYAHLYHHHFQALHQMGAEGIINTCFKHFLFFILEFDLVHDSELAPLADLIERFKKEEAAKLAQVGTL
jgi:MOB kinase activator 1